MIARLGLGFIGRSILCIAVFTFSIVTDSDAQDRKFHFGINAAMVASQIDGDELRGFNKIGLQGGLVSGYSFNDQHWLHVGLEYTSFGSNKRNEDAEMSTEIGMQSINVVVAYSIRFGDSWEGDKRFRVILGPKYQRIITVKSSDVNEDMLHKDFIAGYVGFSYIFSEALMLDLAYTHSFSNILKEELISTNSLVPYYLTLGLTYYVFR